MALDLPWMNEPHAVPARQGDELLAGAARVGTAVVVGSVAVLSVAGVLWVLFPSWRPEIAAAVIVSPIPPVPN